MALSGELTKLRLIERALYDHESSWGIVLGEDYFPAEVMLTGVGVEFVAEVGWGAECPVEGRMALWLNDRQVTPTGDEVWVAEAGELITYAVTLGALAAA